jgi:hypothetical protein
MGTANRDASQVTVKKRNQAENAYYNDWKNATVLANGPVNAAVTRPTGAGAQVISEIKLGCVACYAATGVDVNQNAIPNYSTGGAGGNM